MTICGMVSSNTVSINYFYIMNTARLGKRQAPNTGVCHTLFVQIRILFVYFVLSAVKCLLWAVIIPLVVLDCVDEVERQRAPSRLRHFQ